MHTDCRSWTAAEAFDQSLQRWSSRVNAMITNSGLGLSTDPDE